MHGSRAVAARCNVVRRRSRPRPAVPRRLHLGLKKEKEDSTLQHYWNERKEITLFRRVYIHTRTPGFVCTTNVSSTLGRRPRHELSTTQEDLVYIFPCVGIIRRLTAALKRVKSDERSSDGEEADGRSAREEQLWSYFELETGGRARCVLCRAALPTHSDTLGSHLESHHSELAAELTQVRVRPRRIALGLMMNALAQSELGRGAPAGRRRAARGPIPRTREPWDAQPPLAPLTAPSPDPVLVLAAPSPAVPRRERPRSTVRINRLSVFRVPYPSREGKIKVSEFPAPISRRCRSRVGRVRPLSLFYSDASADGVEEGSLVPRSRSHARLRRNVTMSHAFSCVQPAFIDL
ncbi:hypothetical protein EVAR_88037_1 [Eumeta japonica]|uniref:BED-type domain-containing protein n=1 Tax=Eumeta variegata TaxID=151549 RepID=A0A4C1VDZ9_EUMVA|nr:hypothetical protein EVAR_88037_1 [Eumeta japonica]